MSRSSVWSIMPKGHKGMVFTPICSYNNLTLASKNSCRLDFGVTSNISEMLPNSIGLKFPNVKKMVKSGQMFIKHIDINSMIVEPLTKGLTPTIFHEHAAHM